MICQNDSLLYMNVYSKSYRFPYKQMSTAFHDFSTLFRKNNLTATGNLFYSIEWVNKDADMVIEVFQSAKEGFLPNSGMNYQSYFLIHHMSSVVVLNDFEKNVERAYELLMNDAKKMKLKVCTPFFHEIHKIKGLSYCVVKALIS
ncbi:MAG: DUF5085 family protein [Hespellia sp.]|nr:DUF5085 family protein [Hespellia sp.]